MPFYNFNDDLPIAKQTEQEVGKLLSEKYHASILTANNSDGRYDLMVKTKNGEIITIEVKEDFLCGRTGNVAVEFSCRGKPSGIEKTCARIHIHKLHLKDDKIVILSISTNTLKRMISSHLYHKIVCGGDFGSNSMNYLFKLDVFMKYGKEL